ncbi:MAG: succinate dehydrogenase assembly factor 2 [Gammaproteobacteria bacterium]|nr:succinate dehydrogenase assembly factor 2 [Gammaproteobacteria bacterium]NNC96544.1 succinate dehydrogenase assembly factor 2 [Gammaproteobacteria bacterium]NNM12903.1 succinate dehydrogenase assembly factor 2 [Gammaproteobacteria bacterium]
MRELDVLLEQYLDQIFPIASATEQQGFVDLLALEDPVLFGYIIGREQPSNETMQKLVITIRNIRET